MPVLSRAELDAATRAAAADVAQLPLHVVRDVHEAVLPSGLEELASLIPADLPGVAVPDEVAGRRPQAHAGLQGVVAGRAEMRRHMAAEAVRDGQAVGLLHIRGGSLPVEDLRREVVEERGLLHEGAADERGDARRPPRRRRCRRPCRPRRPGPVAPSAARRRGASWRARRTPPREARACTSSRPSARRAGRGRAPCRPSPRGGRGERPRPCRCAGQGRRRWWERPAGGQPGRRRRARRASRGSPARPASRPDPVAPPWRRARAAGASPDPDERPPGSIACPTIP